MPKNTLASQWKGLADSLEHKSLESVVRSLLVLLEAVTHAESTYFTTIDEQKQTQKIVFARNTHTERMTIPENLEVEWRDTLCKRALDSQSFVCANVGEVWGDSEAAAQLGIRTYISAPIYSKEHRIHGTLCAASAKELHLPEHTQHALKVFAHLIEHHVQRDELIQELEQRNQQLEQLAAEDALTGLMNRRMFLGEMARLLAKAQRESLFIVVAFVDLDGFKNINDTYGHAVGDHFLQWMAQRLKGGVRSEDILARYGGDEFVILSWSTHPLHTQQLQQRWTQLTQGTFVYDTVTVDYPGASVGVIEVDDPEHGTMEIIAKADAHMYERKKLRKICRTH